MNSVDNGRYKDPKFLAKCIQCSLVLFILFSIIDSAVLSSASSATHAHWDKDARETEDLLKWFIDAILTLIKAFNWVAFVVWFRRIRKNLDVSEVTGFWFKPRDCILGFIIVFAPIAIGEELWKSTTPLTTTPAEWKKSKIGGLVIAWYLALLGSFMAHRSVINGAKVLTPDDNGSAAMLNLASATHVYNFSNIVLGVLAFMLVQKLTARQVIKRQEFEQRSLVSSA